MENKRGGGRVMLKPYKLYLFNEEEVKLLSSSVTKYWSESYDKKNTKLCNDLENLQKKIRKIEHQ